MEAAQAAAQDGEPIVIHNVDISMHTANGAYYGFFQLPRSFCFKRKIKLLKNSRGDDEDANDYLCLRIPLPLSDKTGVQHRCRNVWLAHAVATYSSATQATEETVKCEFKLQHFSRPPPEGLLSKKCMPGNTKFVSGTVEILPKPLPFR
jgi:hypothetical protein